MKPTRPKLKMLKPRLATLNTDRLPVLKTGARANGDGSTARGYNYRWQKARERFLYEHPLCCYCEREGRVSAASVVDHIEPHRGDQSLFWNESNWQSLCKPCHDSIKAKEKGRGAKQSLGPVHSSRFVFTSWNLDVGHESANVER